MKPGRNRNSAAVVAVIIALAASTPSHAQPAPDTPWGPPVTEPAKPGAPADTAAPASAPEGTQEEMSGLVESRDPPESGGRTVGRVLLLPLRGLWFVVWGPIRLAAWAF